MTGSESDRKSNRPEVRVGLTFDSFDFIGNFDVDFDFFSGQSFYFNLHFFFRSVLEHYHILMTHRLLTVITHNDSSRLCIENFCFFFEEIRN